LPIQPGDDRTGKIDCLRIVLRRRGLLDGALGSFGRSRLGQFLGLVCPEIHRNPDEQSDYYDDADGKEFSAGSGRLFGAFLFRDGGLRLEGLEVVGLFFGEGFFFEEDEFFIGLGWAWGGQRLFAGKAGEFAAGVFRGEAIILSA